jgi:hypothetical protein
VPDRVARRRGTRRPSSAPALAESMSTAGPSVVQIPQSSPTMEESVRTRPTAATNSGAFGGVRVGAVAAKPTWPPTHRRPRSRGALPRPLTAPLPPGEERPSEAIVLAMRRETAEWMNQAFLMRLVIDATSHNDNSEAHPKKQII